MINNHGSTSALYVFNNMCVFWGTSFYTLPHYHDTLQLVFDIDNEVLIKDENSDWKPYKAAVIKEMHLHQLDSNNNIQLFIYIDPDSTPGKVIKSKFLKSSNIEKIDSTAMRGLSNKFFKELLVEEQSCDKLYESCLSIIEHITGINKTERELDPRISKTLEIINNSDLKQFKLKDLAEQVNLSESRLRHLFKEQMGQPLKNYILWTRLIQSLNKITNREKLTNVAYDCGFTDLPHMTKAYAGMLGVLPSKVSAESINMKIVTCNTQPNFSFITGIEENGDTNEIDVFNDYK